MVRQRLTAEDYAAMAAAADSYPERPVKLIVGFQPGGPTDLIGRLIAQKLSEETGKNFIIENLPGAGGNVGAGRVAQSAPDGYTLLVTGGNLNNNPFLYSHVPYDALKSFDAVTLTGATPVVLAVNPSVPAHSVNEYRSLHLGRDANQWPSGNVVFGDEGDRYDRTNNKNIRPRHMIGNVEDSVVMRRRAIDAYIYAQKRAQHPVVVRRNETPTGQPEFAKQPLDADQQRCNRKEKYCNEKRARHRRSILADHTLGFFSSPSGTA